MNVRVLLLTLRRLAQLTCSAHIRLRSLAFTALLGLAACDCGPQNSSCSDDTCRGCCTNDEPSSSPDAGGVDAGGVDAGGVDAGGVDAGGVDAGGVDAGGADVGDGGFQLFISSMWYGGDLGGGDGGAALADELCQLHARAGLKAGTWQAWLGDSTTPAAQRLRGTGPWFQQYDDGGWRLTFTAVPDGGVPLWPIEVNERGSTEFYYGPQLYWTGNTTTGPVPNTETCLDFTSDDAWEATIGVAGSTWPGHWTEAGTKPCYWFNSLLCFQVALEPPALAMSAAHKRVFITRQTFTANLGGLAGADSACDAIARDAGLPGDFAAFLGTLDGGPATRFHSGGPWYQHFADGGVQLTFVNADNLGTTPLVALRADERGLDRYTVNNSCTFWTGGIGAHQPAFYTCEDWTNETFQSFRNASTGSLNRADPKWLNYQWQECSNRHTLLCLER